MKYRVLVVDDSSFFQTRLREIINESPELEVVGIAANGQEAIDKDAELKPDVISMDYEMPLVDGITALRTILSRRSVPIVMFSSMTYEGARITLEALDAGAVDFIPKNFAEVSNNSAFLKRKLHETLVAFARNARPVSQQLMMRTTEHASATSSSAASQYAASRRGDEAHKKNSVSAPPSRSHSARLQGKVKILVIGASTGGPVAVTQIVTNLPASFPIPIVVAQHMPENFTKAFSERLDKQSQLRVKEGENGDRLSPGCVYVAPGGKQLMFDKSRHSIKVIDGDDRVNYKPSVDITFASSAQVFGSGTLALILTGMGSDGCDGARLIKQSGGQVWAQSKETCVVYGMPAAVVNSNLADNVMPIADFAAKLLSEL